MGFDDSLGDGQADAHADGVQLAGDLAAVEEGRADLAELFGGDAEADILDGQDETAVDDIGGKFDGTSVAVVGDGILDDDEQDIAHLSPDHKPRGSPSSVRPLSRRDGG